MRTQITLPILFISIILFTLFSACNPPKPLNPPNILWITSEDNSAYFLGAYGNNFATTPNLDKLGNEGFLYTKAYATSPVCHPSRNSIITGVYAASNGNENMASNYPTSSLVRTYAERLREAGYYCTNNSKTAYNSGSISENIWDESSGRAHYLNRPEGKNFFAVFNLFSSHESANHRFTETNKLRHSAEEVKIPPYHPDVEPVKHDWAQYHDRVENMDTEVGMLLNELEENGLAENTIVFYYSDHGGVLPRSKRFCNETGTHIPLIIRIPEKYKYLYPSSAPGTKVDRLVNFVDFAPTLYSLLGLPIPEFIQGEAFLGDQKSADPEVTFMTGQRMDERFDNVRSVRDSRYRYIRNYMPHRMTMQHVDYLYLQPSAVAWKDAFEAGKTDSIQSRYFQDKPVEELYDTENDYWETRNLAGDPEYTDVLERMRGKLDSWRMEIKDGGVIPETEYKSLAGDQSLYDYLRSDDCPFEELIEASDLAVMGNSEDIETFMGYLKHENSAMRYWGATGLLLLKEDARPVISALEKASSDESGSVASIAAEALYQLGEVEAATDAYTRILTNKEQFQLIDRYFALGSIDALGEVENELKSVVQQLAEELEEKQAQRPGQSGIPRRPETEGQNPQKADSLSSTLGKISTVFFQGVGIDEGVMPDPYYDFFLPYDLRIARYLLKKWGNS